MAWDKTFPTNATKLRLAPTGITGNWNALETGGVPFDTLQLQQQAAAPSRQNSTGWLYGRNPGAGFTELFYEDDQNPSNLIQLTQNGRLGSTSTGLNTSGVSFDGTYINTQDAFVSAFARCNGAGGTYGTPYHISGSSRLGAGSYTIGTDSIFANDDAGVIATARVLGANDPITANIVGVAFLAGGLLIGVEVRNRSGTLVDCDFDITIYGGT